jgi:hypothetical protein
MHKCLDVKAQLFASIVHGGYEYKLGRFQEIFDNVFIENLNDVMLV